MIRIVGCERRWLKTGLLVGDGDTRNRRTHLHRRSQAAWKQSYSYFSDVFKLLMVKISPHFGHFILSVSNRQISFGGIE